jgi:hypothetical protein
MNNGVKVIDNFLDLKYLEQLQNTCIHGAQFPWYYNESVVYQEKILDNYQFTHMFYNQMVPQSDFYKFLSPILEQLNILSLIRIKANLIPKNSTIIEHGYHTDVYDVGVGVIHKTAVLYLNTNNGYTLFRDGTRVNSLANRIAIFDSTMEHTGTTCTDQKCRVVINFNYFEK